MRWGELARSCSRGEGQPLMGRNGQQLSRPRRAAAHQQHGKARRLAGRPLCRDDHHVKVSHGPILVGTGIEAIHS